MKKVLLTLAGVALLAVVFSSCKKECYCSASYSGITLINDQMVGEMSAADCEAYNNDSWTALGYTFECEAR